MNIARYACHGLGVVQPIDLLVADLLRQHPGTTWNVVGGFNPPLEETAIRSRIRADAEAGKDIIWIGHSMGAALGFYLPMARSAWKFKLIITVDPMSWASNIDCAEWATSPPHPGQWRAEGAFERWINIRTRMYPGGGVLVTKDPRCHDFYFPDCDHIGVIADPRVRKIIFDAVQKAGD
jgi:pimeloyl-ACP methyl ester carboxylesterase